MKRYFWGVLIAGDQLRLAAGAGTAAALGTLSGPPVFQRY